LKNPDFVAVTDDGNRDGVETRRNQKNTELGYIFIISFIGMSFESNLFYLNKISSTRVPMLSHPDDTSQETLENSGLEFRIRIIKISKI
jgi:hypothetical protein